MLGERALYVWAIAPIYKTLSVGPEWEQYVQVLWEFVDSVGTLSASSGSYSSKLGWPLGVVLEYRSNLNVLCF